MPGIGDPVTARAFRGEPAEMSFLLVDGRWLSRPGDAVAPLALMRDAHLKLGDRFTATAAGKPLTLTLVGEALDADNGSHSLFEMMVMVATSPAPVAIVAAALAFPAGVALDHLFMYILGSTAGGNDIPPAVYELFPAWELMAIPVMAVTVAVAPLVPGRWAARANVVAALHAE